MKTESYRTKLNIPVNYLVLPDSRQRLLPPDWVLIRVSDPASNCLDLTVPVNVANAALGLGKHKAAGTVKLAGDVGGHPADATWPVLRWERLMPFAAPGEEDDGRGNE